jgi:SAM-dependent methyltransferase
VTLRTARGFYARPSWDETAWTNVIAIEYERLTATYPFADRLEALAPGGPHRVLDVGCGTAIFPRYLDPRLPDSLRLDCDLLDISPVSLGRAREALERLPHFRVRRTIQAAIEDIPSALSAGRHQYDVIWAIHSLTTVDLNRMPEVIRHLLRLLAPKGMFFIYQLTARSSYQVLHAFYRRYHPQAGGRFMQSEDSERILRELATPYELHELQFDHQLPEDRSDLLQNYLRKCVLDESLDALRFFAPLLPRFHDPPQRMYRFPQSVNFLSVPRPQPEVHGKAPG